MSACNPPREFGPEDDLAPNAPKFGEAWHAQVLAMADTLVTTGQISASDWAETLGAERRVDEINNAPDTEETYYAAALRALERLLDITAIVPKPDLNDRRDTWARAYLATPHGQPVELTAGKS
ncbi:hypothetical protein [Halocynthiibacter namhaensis]|uniref:hypothetical protein n=1 Tax=Halocynthiibacter namhaensis TaxID=1290553 RepID=UPI00068D886A|nr:hypothetical protein [Halocynthiibacter namhaensis]